MSSVWNGITDGEVQASSEARPSSRQCGPGGPSEAARLVHRVMDQDSEECWIIGKQWIAFSGI